jgi:tetratricopeptide (TPR) repeat protein/tRNA A-37 threonylcarbamoyl transferase component Bud32
MTRLNPTYDLEDQQIDARVISTLFAEEQCPVRLGRYVILGRLGQGGMGIVYSAFDDALDRRVAIKVIHRNLDSETRRRAIREAQALARLTHPNVVAVHDVNLDGDVMWIAMEFVSGETLRTWARARPRTWREVLKVLKQTARGVAAAHTEGLVHRDLKPENVMIGGDGRVLVLDFGLAHGRGAGLDGLDEAVTARMDVDGAAAAGALTLQLTPSGLVQGTPAYLSPEQWRGERADAASDQFSWCVMAWELLFDERPFAGETAPDLRRNVLAGAARAPNLARDVPTWLRRLVERGLQSDRARRWPSMAELEAALAADPTRRIQAGGAVLAVAVVLGGGVGISRWNHQNDITACDRHGDAIDDVWNENTRSRLQERILGTGLANAAMTLEKTTPWIDDYARKWRETRVEVCHAGTIDNELDPETLAKAENCLDERRLELEGTLEILSSPTTEGRALLNSAVAMVSRFSSVADCQDALRLASQPSLPDDGATRDEILRLRRSLARAGALDLAGSFHASIAVVDNIRRDADKLGWAPLQAATSLRHGSLLHQMGESAAAETAYQDAFYTAGHAGADNTMVDATNALAYLVGCSLDRHSEGHQWARMTGMLLDRMGAPANDLRRARMHTMIGHIYYDTGEYASATENHQRALEIKTEVLGPSHPEVAWSLSGVAMNIRNTGAPDEALQLFEKALVIKEATLGPRHQKVGLDLINLAAAYQERGDNDRAIELNQRAADILNATLGELHDNSAALYSNLAAAYNARGDHEKALIYARRALDVGEKTLGAGNSRMANYHQTMANIYYDTKDFENALRHQERVREIRVAVFGADDEHVAFAIGGLANIYLDQGAPERALALQQESLAILRKKLPETDAQIAKCLHNLGNVQLRMGAYEQALASERRALEIWEAALGPDNPELVNALVNIGTIYVETERSEHAREPLQRAVALRERQSGKPVDLAEARFALARALWSDELERSTSHTLARFALDTFCRAGDLYAEDCRRVQEWLGTHDVVDMRHE